jgi:hypothetical protein
MVDRGKGRGRDAAVRNEGLRDTLVMRLINNLCYFNGKELLEG